MKNKFFFSAMLVLLAFGLTITSCAGTTRSPEEVAAADLAREAAALKVLNSDLSVNAVKAEGANLSEKIEWIYKNALKNAAGKTYLLEINTDESINLTNFFWNQGVQARRLNIIFRGIGTNRTIYIEQATKSQTLTVASDQTLVLDDNITIHGPPRVGYNNRALVEVSSGGVLVMNEGSTITGGINTDCNLYQGGGVYVSNGGTFIMKGGTITRNAIYQVPDPTMIEASKGKYNALTKRNCYGAGVYVNSGTFIKTGGTITGHSSDPTNGNYVGGFDNKGVINNNGHAISIWVEKNMFLISNLKNIDTSVGPNESFYFDGRTFKDVPVAQPVAEPIIQSVTEPNNNIEPSINNSQEIQETVQQVPQKTPVTPQEALQEYQAAAQKMQATQREALQEYQAEMQKNPAAQQEAVQKYQKALQEAQLQLQEAAKKYQETMQNKR